MSSLVSVEPKKKIWLQTKNFKIIHLCIPFCGCKKPKNFRIKLVEKESGDVKTFELFEINCNIYYFLHKKQKIHLEFFM
jgi:hypothetical protein